MSLTAALITSAAAATIGTGLKVGSGINDKKKEEEEKKENEAKRNQAKIDIEASKWSGGGNNVDKAMSAQNYGDGPLYGGNGLTPMDVFRRR